VNKAELLEHLEGRYEEWRSFLDQLPADGMEEPGVNGEWSMKNVIAHLTGWNHHLVERLRAALAGEPLPASPWPSELVEEDDTNAWIHEAHKDQSLAQVRDETDRSLREVLSLVAGMSTDIRIEVLHNRGLDFHLIWVGEERFVPGEFFDHFRDDHQPDVEEWLSLRAASSGARNGK